MFGRWDGGGERTGHHPHDGDCVEGEVLGRHVGCFAMNSLIARRSMQE